METRSRLALRRVQPEARGLESHSWEGKRWGKTPGKSHIARGKSTRNGRLYLGKYGRMIYGYIGYVF
jgi:hypothetical protein